MNGLRAGFVGLGKQGGPMAMRVAQAGMPLTVWARRSEVLVPFLEAGAEAASGLDELGARAEALGICVFGDADVLEICEGVLPTMSAGSVLLIHSTVHPDTIGTVAEAAARRGVAVLDAPVSGGGARAANATLTVMIGGDAKALAQVRPMIECYAGLIAHLGGLGAGAKAKLINNAMMAANLATSHEAMLAGGKLGLDRAALLELVSASSGTSFAHDLYSGRGGLADFAHSVDLLTKDVALLESVANVEGADVQELARHARCFFDQVRAATGDS